MSAPHSNDVPKNRLAVTQADLEPVLIPHNRDLNDYTATGKYHQGMDVGARDGTNYPVSNAGYLEVVRSSESGAMIYQMYRTYGHLNKVYVRSRYQENWSSWKELSVEGHKHPVGDLTATGTASSTTYLRGDGTWATPTDTNTTYSVMSEVEATAGVSNTARTTSAVVLKGAIQRWATGTYSTAISAIGQALNRAATAAEARAAIGAGTSNLAIGTTASTAKAGNYVPAWGEVTGKPTTFPPDTHSHTTAQVTGLDSALAGKVIASGATTTLWTGSQSAYDALPTATRNAIGFIAVIV